MLIEKAIKPKITDSYQRKIHPDIVHDFTRFTTESIKGIMKDIVNMAKKKKKKKVGGEGFQDMNPRESEELKDTTWEELTEDNVMEKSISQ